MLTLRDIHAAIDAEFDRREAANVGAGYTIPRSTPMLTEQRVRDIVNEEFDKRLSMMDPDSGQVVTPPRPGTNTTPTTVDSGKTFVPRIGKMVPNALIDPDGHKEGPMAYVSRIALFLADGDMDKARELTNDLGALAPQGPGAASYGFTDDLASYPEAAVTFAEQIFAKPAQGQVGR